MPYDIKKEWEGPSRKQVPVNRSVALGSGTASSLHTTVKMSRRPAIAPRDRMGTRGWDYRRVPRA